VSHTRSICLFPRRGSERMRALIPDWYLSSETWVLRRGRRTRAMRTCQSGFDGCMAYELIKRLEAYLAIRGQEYLASLGQGVSIINGQIDGVPASDDGG
jgi:hypothetical protein